MSTRQQPSDDLLVRIAAAMDECVLVLLRCGLGKGSYLLDGLSLVPWEHRPLANDLSARFALPLDDVRHMRDSLNAPPPRLFVPRHLSINDNGGGVRLILLFGMQF